MDGRTLAAIALLTLGKVALVLVRFLIIPPGCRLFRAPKWRPRLCKRCEEKKDYEEVSIACNQTGHVAGSRLTEKEAPWPAHVMIHGGLVCVEERASSRTAQAFMRRGGSLGEGKDVLVSRCVNGPDVS